MRKLTFNFIVFLFSVLLTANGWTSQEVKLKSTKLNEVDTGHLINASYAAPSLLRTLKLSIDEPNNYSVKTTLAAVNAKPLANELPANKSLTLLAGLAVIFVIAKRRISNKT